MLIPDLPTEVSEKVRPGAAPGKLLPAWRRDKQSKELSVSNGYEGGSGGRARPVERGSRPAGLIAS
jgi:hypothetical protein